MFSYHCAVIHSAGKIRSYNAGHWTGNTSENSTERLDRWMSVGWTRSAMCCVNEHGLRQRRNKGHYTLLQNVQNIVINLSSTIFVS